MKAFKSLLNLWILLGIVLLSTYSCKKDKPETPLAPVINTIGADSVRLYRANVKGNVETGTEALTEFGICYGIHTNPTANDFMVKAAGTTGEFTCKLKELKAGTHYFARAYAIDKHGTYYGKNIEFETMEATVNDIDQNVYDAIEIGNQVWLKQNLKTTRFSNGDLIDTTETMNADIVSSLIVEPRFQWPAQGDEANVEIYGRHYTWYVTIDSRKICPSGWHVPSDTEWTELINFLGGEAVAGGKLKSIEIWPGPNTGATDEFGFSAVPGGHRIYAGYWGAFGQNATMWTSTEIDNEWAKSWVPINEGTRIYPANWVKKNAAAIRCIKN